MNEPLKIAFWLPNFEATGLQTSTILIADSLARRGVAVDLVVSNNQGSLAGLVRPPVQVVDLDLGNNNLGKGLFKAVGYVRRERPNAIFAYSGSGHLLALLVQLARRPTQIWIWELSTKRYRKMARKKENKGKILAHRVWLFATRSLYYVARRALIHRVGGVVTNSKAVAEEVEATLSPRSGKVHVIYNACAADLDAAAARANSTARAAKGEGPLIISVGRLSPRKDLDVLLRAFRQFRDQRPARLSLIGDGPHRGALEALTEELGLQGEVDFAGFQLDPFGYGREADLFALAAREEPFGNVLVEAMAAGIPVVSTASTGPREILEGGRYGPLVPVLDPEALAKAIADALDNPVDRDVLVKRAMAFHADRIASQYCNALGFPERFRDVPGACGAMTLESV
jgi:glycosyltransferase involved in cell wall biosynthesis